MKKLKKIVCLLLVFTLLFGVLPNTIKVVQAKDKVLKENQTEHGELQTGEKKSFKFDVSVESDVTIVFEGDDDTYGTYGKYILQIKNNSDTIVYEEEGNLCFEEKVISIDLPKGTYTLILQEAGNWEFEYLFYMYSRSLVKIPVENLEIDKSSISLNKGETYKLKATYLPIDTTFGLSWSSANEKVATVSSGKIKAVGVGTTTITAKMGDKTATCTVAVKNVEVKKLTLNKSSVNLTLGKKCYLNATYSPTYITDSLSWSSANKKVATVSNYGRVVAVALGTTTITAKMGKKTAKCTVTVNSTYTEIDKGISKSLTSFVKNVDGYKKAIWKSSKPSVATISSNGKIKATKHGKTTITAEVSGKKYSLTVYVYDNEVLRKEAQEKLKSILKNPNSLIVNKIDGKANWITIDYSAMNGFGGYNRDMFFAWYSKGVLECIY